MAKKRKYPVTGRDTPAREILAVLAASALVILWATQARIAGTETWHIWFAAGFFPGVLLRWLEIVRRTRWPWLEIAVLALMLAILIWGYVRIGGWPLGLVLVPIAGILGWCIWRQFSSRK